MLDAFVPGGSRQATEYVSGSIDATLLLRGNVKANVIGYIR